MSRAQRWGMRGLIALAVLAAVRFGGAPVAEVHVRTVTGRQQAGDVSCWNCHLTGGSILPRKGLPHADPWFLAASPDGRTLWAACGPIRKVARIDLEAGTAELSPELPGQPRGLALSPEGDLLAVALGGADEVALLDPASFEIRARLAAGVEPVGLAFAGGKLYVANSRSGDVSVLEVPAGDPASGRESHRLAAGREPFAVAASPDGATVAVVSRMVEIDRPDRLPRSEVTLLDAASGTVRRRVELESVHLAEAAAFTPDGRHLLVPAIQVRNLLPILQVARGWVMSSVLAVVETDGGRVTRLPLNEPNVPFPDPSAVAVDPSGERVWVASGGSDRVAVLDLPALLAAAGAADPEAPEDLSLTCDYLIERFEVGRNPRALARVNGSLAVAERLGDSLALFDGGGEEQGRIPVGPPAPADEIRRGDAVFHDASYAFQGSFSCRSCHPGGHTDGLTYDFDIDGAGRDVVLNRSLQGVRGTEPFKWIGLNPSLQRQCGPRFAMVLTRADPFPEDRLEDLVAYLESLPPPRPDPRAGQVGEGDSGAVERGRGLFERETRKNGEPIPPQGRCNTCHAGPHYTNRLKADVGTRSPWDSTGEFDVPHLTGIGSKAPYLHDGRALTLEEIWTAPGVLDQHGVVTDLSKSDLNDLVEYLKGL